MSRGKYKAKAINRAAAVNNDVIAELRAQLAAVTAELERSRRQLIAEQTNRRALAAEQAKANIVALEEEHENRLSALRNRVGVVIDRLLKLQREDPACPVLTSTIDDEIAAPLAEIAGREHDIRKLTPGTLFADIWLDYRYGRNPNRPLSRRERRAAERVFERYADSGSDVSKPSKMERDPRGYAPE